jgi:hypothetical protein
MIKMMMLLLMATVALTVIMIKKMNCWVFAAILICGVTSVKALLRFFSSQFEWRHTLLLS